MVGGGFSGWGKRGGIGLVAVTSADVWPFGKMMSVVFKNPLVRLRVANAGLMEVVHMSFFRGPE